MTEVTAEMIERGRGLSPRVAAERRRTALKVREAREKLTSSGSGHRAFDLQLLRLYAVRRKAAAPGLVLLSLVFAVVAIGWTTTTVDLGWLGMNAAGLLCTIWLSDRFVARCEHGIDVRRWSRLFVAAETAQGASWSLIVLTSFGTTNAHAVTFCLVALLLFAAMNVTVVAMIPVSIYGVLTPITAAVILVLRPHAMTSPETLLAVLALGTEIYFVVLARKLYASTLQSLLFQAEKDELIAELEQAKANSDLARRRAEESNIAKSRFLATMSHELRTPLNAILGFSEVMKAELFGGHVVPAYKDYASDIHSSGQHLLMLINEILDLSRVEAGRYELREESVDLQSLIEECRHLMALRGKKKDILIQQEDGPPLPRLWADERAVRQVALNLLSNAIKFTPQGGCVQIACGWTACGGQFFSISDTGPGIPESEIPIVMSSFGRGSFAQKTAEEGSGLGLPIVKGLVDLHGGTFEIKSRIREGTTVTVGFPSQRVMSVLPRLNVEPELPHSPQAFARAAA